MNNFEDTLRMEIVTSAESLNRSHLSFSYFDESRCNYKYWNRTVEGGFLLKYGAIPSDAINDIFVNGHQYATECATALMIVYYKALLNVYKRELFNNIFRQIYLMGWKVTEPLLKEVSMLEPALKILPGDRQYFANPDVDPQDPAWQGENVILLPNSMYYGHGVGIRTANEIIYILNSKRREGTVQSAYLLNKKGHPNFQKLSGVCNSSMQQASALAWWQIPPFNSH